MLSRGKRIQRIAANWVAAIAMFLLGIAQAGDAAKPEELTPYTEVISGTPLSFKMVPIPAGKVLIGSPANEEGHGEDESPQKEVAIRAFWMSEVEVTWDVYDAFAFSEGLEAKRAAGVDVSRLSDVDKLADAVSRPTPPYMDPTFGLGRDDQPALCITHHAAMEYCRWLSAKTGKLYRLPTEAEWEYACRAGAKTAYHFGDDPKQLGDYAWHNGNSNSKPHPVRQKKPNAWGLYDMHGNVAEWSLDRYDAKFYESIPLGAVGPVVPPKNEKYPHTARGGSWDDVPSKLRSAARRASEPLWSDRDPNLPKSIWWHTDATFVGFRVVRALEEQDNLKGVKSQVVKEED